MGWTHWAGPAGPAGPAPIGPMPFFQTRAEEIAWIADRLVGCRAAHGSEVQAYRDRQDEERATEPRTPHDPDWQFWHGKTPAERELEARRRLQIHKLMQQTADRAFDQIAPEQPKPAESRTSGETKPDEKLLERLQPGAALLRLVQAKFKRLDPRDYRSPVSGGMPPKKPPPPQPPPDPVAFEFHMFWGPIGAVLAISALFGLAAGNLSGVAARPLCFIAFVLGLVLVFGPLMGLHLPEPKKETQNFWRGVFVILVVAFGLYAFPEARTRVAAIIGMAPKTMAAIPAPNPESTPTSRPDVFGQLSAAGVYNQGLWVVVQIANSGPATTLNAWNTSIIVNKQRILGTPRGGSLTTRCPSQRLEIQYDLTDSLWLKPLFIDHGHTVRTLMLIGFPGVPANAIDVTTLQIIAGDALNKTYEFERVQRAADVVKCGYSGIGRVISYK